MTELPHAHGGPPLTGVLRAAPEDFFVEEDLGFAADGAGEHVLLRVEKRGANTDFVARELAKYADIAPDAVSYAGLKDRHAVTRQTFSLHLPGKRVEPDWMALRHEEFRVLEAQRHSRKLKRGALKGNRFRIVLREVAGDRARAEIRIAAITSGGVPNYFGEQRFGHGGANVERALKMFEGRRFQRHERSLLLSAARSHLFNAVLAERIEAGNWCTPLAGEVWMLAGTHSIFGPEPLGDELVRRFADGDIGLTGPLWGKGALRSADEVAQIEAGVVAQHAQLATGLEANGLNQERRTLALRPQDFSVNWLTDRDLELVFWLPAGAYATVVLREICAWM
ncbi:tRNA pseudouridine(13) synthase TruD [Rudaea sp.]|uniref:tRNA pseudouridine(13) synthase TruD n=1 Tax=Rudaea sp. TaxID=2136325 RepID=UPI002ED4D6AD